MNCYTLSIYRINAQKIIFLIVHLKQLRSISHPRNWGRWKACWRKEQLRFAFRVAARLLHSGKLTAVQRRCFIAYFIKGKTVAEIAHDEKTYRMTIWRHIRRLEAALRDAVCMCSIGTLFLFSEMRSEHYAKIHTAAA